MYKKTYGMHTFIILRKQLFNQIVLLILIIVYSFRRIFPAYGITYKQYLKCKITAFDDLCIAEISFVWDPLISVLSELFL
jgi:hypothetical protein